MFHPAAHKHNLKMITPLRDCFEPISLTHLSAHQSSQIQINAASDLISQNHSNISFRANISQQDICQMLEMTRMINFMNQSVKQKKEIINCKMHVITRIKQNKEELQIKLSSIHKFITLKKSALKTKKHRLMQERASKKLCIDKQIQQIKDQIINMRMHYSDNKYRDNSIKQSNQIKGSKKSSRYAHRRLYSQESQTHISEVLGQANRIYIPLPPTYYNPVAASSIVGRYAAASPIMIKSYRPSYYAGGNRKQMYMDDSLMVQNNSQKQEYSDKEYTFNFALKLEQTLSRSRKNQQNTNRHSNRINSNNQQTGNRSSRIRISNSRKSSSRNRRPSSKIKNPDANQSEQQIFRQILECSNNGRKDNQNNGEPIAKSIGCLITESSNPQLQVNSGNKKIEKHQKATLLRQANQCSDSQSNYGANLNCVTFNSFGSKEDNQKATLNKDKIYDRANKQIRESNIQIDLSHDSSLHQNNFDDFNIKKPIAQEIHQNPITHHKRSTYKTQIAAFQKGNPISQTLSAGSYQTARLAQSGYVETPRDNPKDSEQTVFADYQEDDILGTIILEPLSKISKKFNKINHQPAISRTSKEFTKNDIIDEDDYSLESIRLSTVSIISKDKNRSLKQSNQRYNSHGSSQQSKKKETSFSQSQLVCDNSYDYKANFDKSEEDFMRLSTSVPMKKVEAKYLLGSPNNFSKLSESIEQVEEQYEEKSNIILNRKAVNLKGKFDNF